jgi:hypothetical protein
MSLLKVALEIIGAHNGMALGEVFLGRYNLDDVAQARHSDHSGAEDAIGSYNRL